MEKQDQPQKKQRSEDVSELGLVQPQGMPDWAKLFRGIMDAIKSLEATVKVQNQCLHHQNLILEDLIHLKVEGVLDVETEEVMGLADEQRKVVKARINMELGSCRSSLEDDEKKKKEEKSESDADGSEV